MRGSPAHIQLICLCSERSAILKDKQWSRGRWMDCKILCQHCRYRTKVFVPGRGGTQTLTGWFYYNGIRTVKTFGFCMEFTATSATDNRHTLGSCAAVFVNSPDCINPRNNRPGASTLFHAATQLLEIRSGFTEYADSCHDPCTNCGPISTEYPP